MGLCAYWLVQYVQASKLAACLILFFVFISYIYLLDLQESTGSAIHRVSNYPDLLDCFRRCQDIAVFLKFNRDMTLI